MRLETNSYCVTVQQNHPDSINKVSFYLNNRSFPNPNCYRNMDKRKQVLDWFVIVCPSLGPISYLWSVFVTDHLSVLWHQTSFSRQVHLSCHQLAMHLQSKRASMIYVTKLVHVFSDRGYPILSLNSTTPWIKPKENTFFLHTPSEQIDLKSP